MVFQLMFAIITPALITGAFAERMKFSAFLLFSLLWATLVYVPLAHWVWGVGGLDPRAGRARLRGRHRRPHHLGRLGPRRRDLIGKRMGFGREPMPPAQPAAHRHRRGHALGRLVRLQRGERARRDGLAATAFVTTNTAAAAAGSPGVAEWLHPRQADRARRGSGAVAGSSPSRRPRASSARSTAILIGLGGGRLCFAAAPEGGARVRRRLDAFGVHGIGGTLGAIATGFFASKAVNAAGNDGLFTGNPGLFFAQIAAVAATWVFAFGDPWSSSRSWTPSSGSVSTRRTSSPASTSRSTPRTPTRSRAATAAWERTSSPRSGASPRPRFPRAVPRPPGAPGASGRRRIPLRRPEPCSAGPFRRCSLPCRHEDGVRHH